MAVVALEKLFLALAGDLIDAVGLRLRSAVAPELYPRVRIGTPLRHEAERRAVGFHRQQCAGGETGADADDVLRAHTGALHHRRHGGL